MAQTLADLLEALADPDGPGEVLSLEEVQATGSVEEASTVVNSDSRSRDQGRPSAFPGHAPAAVAGRIMT